MILRLRGSLILILIIYCLLILEVPSQKEDKKDKDDKKGNDTKKDDAEENGFLVSPEEMSWEEAKDFCSEKDARLVEISDEDTHEALSKFLEKENEEGACWLGLRQQECWLWNSDKPVCFDKWAEEEPKEEGECGQMKKANWHSESCDEKAKACCEKNSVSKKKEVANLDLAFVIDVTGSMGPHLSAVNTNILKIVEASKEKFKNLIRVGFVAYKDKDDADPLITEEFSEDTEKILKALETLRADGGGDLPEDVHGGLKAVLDLDWKQPSKVLVHVADAPAHGKLFHEESIKDDQPEKDPDGKEMKELLEKMQKLEIRYFFGKILKDTDVMIEKFRELAGDKKIVEEFDLSKPEEILNSTIEKIEETIKKNMERVASKMDDKKTEGKGDDKSKGKDDDKSGGKDKDKGKDKAKDSGKGDKDYDEEKKKNKEKKEKKKKKEDNDDDDNNNEEKEEKSEKKVKDEEENDKDLSVKEKEKDEEENDKDLREKKKKKKETDEEENNEDLSEKKKKKKETDEEENNEDLSEKKKKKKETDNKENDKDLSEKKKKKKEMDNKENDKDLSEKKKKKKETDEEESSKDLSEKKKKKKKKDQDLSEKKKDKKEKGSEEKKEKKVKSGKGDKTKKGEKVEESRDYINFEL